MKLYLKAENSTSTTSVVEEKSDEDDAEELVVDVDLPSQRTVELRLRKGDNIQKVVGDFCVRHDIADSIGKHLENYVITQMSSTERHRPISQQVQSPISSGSIPAPPKFDASPRSKTTVSTLQSYENKERAHSQFSEKESHPIDRRLSRLRRWTEGQKD